MKLAGSIEKLNVVEFVFTFIYEKMYSISIATNQKLR